MIGGHWPASAIGSAIARFTEYARAYAFVLILVGAAAFEWAGMEMPSIVRSMSENKMHSALVAFWVSNMIATNCLNTGAFEVYFDGKLVTSKLASKTLPRIDAVFDGIRSIRGK